MASRAASSLCAVTVTLSTVCAKAGVAKRTALAAPRENMERCMADALVVAMAARPDGRNANGLICWNGVERRRRRPAIRHAFKIENQRRGGGRPPPVWDPAPEG